jgi:hypothetical protein
LNFILARNPLTSRVQILVDFDLLERLDNRAKKSTIDAVLASQATSFLNWGLQERSAVPELVLFQSHLCGFGVRKSSQDALSFLVKAAENDSEEAAALVKRVHDALSVPLPSSIQSRLENLLSIGAASGSCIAEEDLQTSFPEAYKDLPRLKRNESKNPDSDMDTPFSRSGISLVTARDRSTEIPWGNPATAVVFIKNMMRERGASNINQFVFDNNDRILHIAAGKASPETIKALADLGAIVDFSNNRSETPLLIACRHGRIDAVNVLLSLGAKATSDSMGENPLHHAAALERALEAENGRDVYGRLMILLGDLYRRGADPAQVGRSSWRFEPAATKGMFGFKPSALTQLHSRAVSPDLSPALLVWR